MNWEQMLPLGILEKGVSCDIDHPGLGCRGNKFNGW